MKRLVMCVPLLLAVVGIALGQVPAIVPGENLVLDGIPAIPTSIAAEVGRYTEFRSATLQGWHPTRKEMLISTRFGDVPQIHQVKFPGGARTQLTFFPDRVLAGVYPPKRDDFVLIMKDVGGGEWYQLYRYDFKTGDITLLTDGKSRNAAGPWSTRGDRLVYTSTRRNGKDVDFYVMDPLNPLGERMLAQLDKGEAWRPLDWSPDDRTILASEYVSINESYLWLFDAATGQKTRLTEPGGDQVSYGGGAFSGDGKGVFVTTDRDGEFSRLAYIDLATGRHTYLTSGIPWDVEEFDLSSDGRKIAFVTNENGVGVLHLLDVKTRREAPVPSLPVGLISGVSWHNDNVHLGFNISSARSPSDVYSLNPSTGKVERWTQSETGGLVTSQFPIAEVVKWMSFDHRTISGFLYRPSSKFTGKRPVIINIHGGPEGQARPGFQGRNNYYLNELGIALLYPNIRGSSGYGKTFLKLDNGLKREDAHRDLGTLLDWVKTQPDLDGDRIMVTGGSYGGFATLAVAYLYSDKIRCAVDIVGISNLVTFLERTEAYRRDLRRIEYGDERDPAMREYFEKSAPVNNAEKIRKPLFVVQGKNDPRVPASEAEQIVETLKGSDTPVWYLLATDEGHGFAKKKNQDFQFYAAVMFVKEFLVK